MPQYQKKPVSKNRVVKKPSQSFRQVSKSQVSLLPASGKASVKGLSGYDASKSLGRQNVVVKAKLIRQMLAKKFPGIDFWVKTDRFSMGESIDVHWVDGPALAKVEPLLEDFKDIRYDGQGEILSGGNSYVEAHRSILPETQAKIDAEVRRRFGKSKAEMPDWDHTFSSERWQMSRTTDFPFQPADRPKPHAPDPSKKKDFLHMTKAEIQAEIQRYKATKKA